MTNSYFTSILISIACFSKVSNSYKSNLLSTYKTSEIQNLLKTRQLSCAELMEETLNQIDYMNPKVNAITFLRDRIECLNEAKQLDNLSKSNNNKLFGIPICIKDTVNVAGFPTSYGFYKNAAPSFVSSPTLKGMKKENCIIIGKTNTPEFGLGSHTYNEVFGSTSNPYDDTKSCGGSSGGSAVALATRMTLFGHGSDMMGSLRNPAGWNNCYSLRPSVHDKSSLLPSCFDISIEGPMANSPFDLSILHPCMFPSFNKYEINEKPTIDNNAELKNIKIAWCSDWGGSIPIEDEILKLCQDILETIFTYQLSCIVIPIEQAPFPSSALWESWTSIRSFHLSRSLPKNDFNLKPEAIYEITKGESLSEQDITQALQYATQWQECCNEAMFKKYDFIALPSSQCFPFPIDTSLLYPILINNVEFDTYHEWMQIQIPVSLAGLPCVTIPIGFSNSIDTKLPIGMQLFAQKGKEKELLELAQCYHVLTDFPGNYPPPILTS